MEQGTNEHPGLGLAGRMIRTFTAPGRTFASVRERSGWLDWLAPTLIVVAVEVAHLAARVPTWYMSGWSEVAPALLFSAATPFLHLFIAGAVLLLVANFILGGGATNGRMLAVTAYASLVNVADRIVTGLLALATGTRVDIAEVFSIWQVLLAAIGTGVMAGCSTRRALVPMLILWAVWRILLETATALYAPVGR